ncbi:MAG: glutamate 5-kinase [Desulfobacterales bacterium]|nr:glutamate 5-kinase [Desulfobacterales bacterium]MDD4073329.1 glutamate 5-kinase [Desulfobacterales bacterium]MDD4391343.1 glutamate 5-kinase [Desulfobacterales bacterium]
MNNSRKRCFESAKRVVIKLGSGVLSEKNGLNLKLIRSVSHEICQLIGGGLEVIVVSSGAMALGVKKVGLPGRPDEIPRRQAVSAVGQAGLILEYEKAFARYRKKTAQILLTGEDLSNRKRYLNARNTINTLLSWGVIPVINENDTVSIEEIKFGDNDNLAAMIAILMDADILINLTDIDGVYTKDPRSFPEAELISYIPSITKNIEKIAGEIPGALGTGGMLSKIKAARKVTAAGIPMVIAKGTEPDILTLLFLGREYGTFFLPGKGKLTSRKCWIAFSLKPKGMIYIDSGAAEAVVTNGKSLLSSGILDVDGDFGVGDPVAFKAADGLPLGTGLVNYGSEDIRKIKGLKSSDIQQRLGSKPYDEVIHRDNLAIISECILP